MKSKKRLIVAEDACKHAKDQLIKGKFNFEEYSYKVLQGAHDFIIKQA